MRYIKINNEIVKYFLSFIKTRIATAKTEPTIATAQRSFINEIIFDKYHTRYYSKKVICVIPNTETSPPRRRSRETGWADPPFGVIQHKFSSESLTPIKSIDPFLD
jgi:hypothetical protein